MARDAAGVKALYWSLCQGRLLFASEVKALFADEALPRKVRLEALPEYFTFSYIPGANTMLEGVYELQPGSLLRFRPGDSENSVSIQRWFRHEEHEIDVSQADGASGESLETWGAKLRGTLEDSVEECCHAAKGGVKPAVFLSGGIDSSAVLALAAKRFPGEKLRTFSVHFGKKYMNENFFVELMTESCQTEHTWLEIRPKDFLKDFKKTIWALDDPIGDPITVPNYLLARAAAKAGAGDLVLNGEGGDPCFGGPKNIPMMLSSIYGPAFSGVDAQSGWQELNYLHSYRRGFDHLAQLLSPDLLQRTGGQERLISILTPFFSAQPPCSYLNKLMVINMRLKGANLILPKVDKMSSAHGVLALAPLFSRKAIEASLQCPPELKLAGGVEKAILKEAVKDLIPQPIIARPKCGMMVPVRYWFQGGMRRYAKKLLAEKKLKEIGWFDPEYVAWLRTASLEDSNGFRAGLKLWMLVTLMLWHESVIENFPKNIPEKKLTSVQARPAAAL